MFIYYIEIILLFMLEHSNGEKKYQKFCFGMVNLCMSGKLRVKD